MAEHVFGKVRTKDIVTEGPWVDVRAYASLAAAIAASGGKAVLFSTDQTLTANLTTAVELIPLNGAKINHGPYTINYSGSTARWPKAQIFNGTGAITLSTTVKDPAGWFATDTPIVINGRFDAPPKKISANLTFGGSAEYSEARPEWWGAANNALSTVSVQAAISTGKNVTIPEGVTYLAKNLTLATAGQTITVNGTLKLPNACADNDAIFTATSIDGLRVVGTGTLDGNRAGQSGTVSQQLIRFITVTNCFIGGGLTFKKNYSGAATSYAAVYVTGSKNKLDNAFLYDWSKEGVYFNDVSYSSVSNLIAIDADGSSWSAVQVGGATSVHNRISGITAKNTGASAVGLDSQYSVMENITVDGVRFQNGVNFGHDGKPASHSTGSNIVVKGLTDNVNATSAGLSIVNGTTDVSISNFTCDGSTQRGINISAGATNVNLTNITLRNCLTAVSVYQAGRVCIKHLALSGAITTGISKDEGATTNFTTLILDTVDLTAATTRISWASGSLNTPYIQYRSVTFDSAVDSEGSTSVAALGAGGTVTVTNVNARPNSRIILEPSNTAGAAAIPFVQTQSDGSFVIQTVNNGAAGAFVRWKIL